MPDVPDLPAGGGEQRELLVLLQAVIEAKDTEIGVLRSGLDAERELRRRLELRVAELERRLDQDSADSGTPTSKESIGARERHKARRRQRQESERDRRKDRKPGGQPGHPNLDDYDIVRIYAAEYRGIVNYYLLAHNVWRLATLRWNAETSMLKTLAAKHKSTVATMAARHKAKVITGDGPRTCFEARLQRTGKKDLIARFGGIVLKRDKRAVITDPAPVPVHPPRKELIDRLRRRWCELCDHGATVTVHHVARLAQLGKAGPGQPAWAALMARKRRKTLIVCRPCHDYIHASPVANAAQSLESPVH